MNTLVSQAKSEARSECFKKFLVKNSKILLLAAAATLVLVIAFTVFRFYQKTQEAKFSELLHQVLIDQQLGNVDKAKEVLKQIDEARSVPNGVKSLASLRYASMLLDENKKEEAAAIYEKISQCSGCDSYVKDLGGLLAVKTWLSDENEIQKDNLLARIEKIESKSKELKYQISEQKALLHLQKNDLAKAYEILIAIENNPEASQNVKARVSESLKIIISKGYEPPVKAVEVKK